jgi:hypothetical protein
MSKTLEDLGYKQTKERCAVCFRKEYKEIVFDYTNNSVHQCLNFNGDIHATYMDMEELKAIYQYCIDNKWI